VSEFHVSPQEERENPDPYEDTGPVPWPMLALVALVFAFCIVYILRSDIETPSVWGDGRDSSELTGAKEHGKVDGVALFASLCVACHQASGLGLPGVFPPLAGSEWVLGKDSTAAAILLHGINGGMTVKGNTYNGVMPAFASQLGDEQIAAVLTYVRSQWGNSAAAVRVETVAQARDAHKGRTAPFAGEKELPARD
jgi:mono/diheme cytochrome c family protein